MTGLPTRGYNDYVRTVEQQGTALVNVSAAATGQPTIYGPFNTETWAAIQYRFAPAGGDQRARFGFFLDEALTQSVADFDLHVLTVENLAGTIIVAGPWLQPTVIRRAADAGATHLFRVTATIRELEAGALLLGDTVLATGSVSIGAGASQTFQFDAAYYGEAHLSFDTNAANWRLVINGRRFDSSVTRRWLNATDTGFPGGLQTDVMVPPLINAATITNGDAAARTFDLAVMGLDQ